METKSNLRRVSFDTVLKLIRIIQEGLIETEIKIDAAFKQTEEYKEYYRKQTGTSAEKTKKTNDFFGHHISSPFELVNVAKSLLIPKENLELFNKIETNKLDKSNWLIVK